MWLGVCGCCSLPSDREKYLRNSSRKMTGIEKQRTANHSVQLRGVIWNTVCCDGERGPSSVHCSALHDSYHTH